MVAISPYGFLLDNQKLGSESDHQKESIGTIFMLCVKFKLEQSFLVAFFEDTLNWLFKLKYIPNKICRLWLSSTVHFLYSRP
jgi:hypothetical protein